MTSPAYARGDHADASETKVPAAGHSSGSTEPLPRVSLLVAMRNEEQHIEGCLRSILEQDYPPELIEVLILDGCSTDNSRRLAERLVSGRSGWLVTDNPGVAQSNGWNIGIERATGDVIGIVSAHAELAPDYVSRAVETLRRTGADLVGGPVHALGVTYVGEAIAIATSSPFGIGNARAHYTTREVEVDTVFQGVCRKEMYERIGAFDEGMVRNQDDELSYRLRERGGRIVCNPAIRSSYYNRGTLRSLARQYASYGFWKVRVMQMLPRQMQLRQFVPAAFVLVLVGASAWSLVSRSGAVALGVVAGTYLIANLGASLVAAAKHGLRYFPALPIVFATLHVSYGSGFLAGLPRWYLKRPQH
jgi:glycosyltransferase involved in cell wall biosynthesis